MAINLLTSARPSSDLGLDPTLLKVTINQEESSAHKDGESSVEQRPLPSWGEEMKHMFLQQLPSAVLAFERTPWDQLLPKVRRLHF